MTTIDVSMLPMVTTATGYVLIETSIARVKPEFEVYQWARRTGNWELLQMNTIQSAVHQFYSLNPDWLPKPIEEVLGEFEKALRQEQKQAQLRQQEVENTKKQGTAILHEIFDNDVNKLLEQVLFERYHTHLLLQQAAKGKGKLQMPTKEDKASIEKTLREHVLVEPAFRVQPSQLGRPATVARMVDAEGKPTDQHALEVVKEYHAETGAQSIPHGKMFIRYMSAVKALGYPTKDSFLLAKRHFGIKEGEPISVAQLKEYLAKH